jgi:diguanylate cyclase (GGDEF)-like protein
MLTARGAPADTATGLENGADDYVSKPFMPREMKARINTGMRIIEMESRLNQSLANMQQLAVNDHLTKLYDRRRFGELAAEELKKTVPLVLFMLDIDHFKLVNDNYGHLAGDTVLQKVAEMCTEQIGVHGTVGRYGGEEFIGMLPGYSLEKSTSIIEGLREYIATTPIKLNYEQIHVTVSIGVAESIADATTNITPLIEVADKALYSAKAAGRNRVIFAAKPIHPTTDTTPTQEEDTQPDRTTHPATGTTPTQQEDTESTPDNTQPADDVSSSTTSI